MKKFLSAVLGVAVTATAFCGYCIAEDKEITVELDGKEIAFDVAPKMVDDRVMVPLRKIFEEIGALVKWDNDTQTVQARKSKKTVSFTVDSKDMSIDKGKTDTEGNPITETVILDVPPMVISDRTLVPVRGISESFNLNVEWDEENQKVIITSNDTKEEETWKEHTGTINLSDLTYTGDGVEVKDKQITITQGGDFVLSGTLNDGSIKISTEQKVKIRLSGAEITSSAEPCIYAENADKLFITLTNETENKLISKGADTPAIYSKDDLEIKGNGCLNIVSENGHGIKASDNLKIESGLITVNAENDGIHINDTFKMTGGELNITSVGDGIDSESIVIIQDGKINIETKGVPTITDENANRENINNDPSNNNEINNKTDKDSKKDDLNINSEDKTKDQQIKDDKMPNRGFGHGGMPPEESVTVEFDKSSKGINADWMMSVTGGDININAASHAIHCADEIEIKGGTFNLSSEYKKGISAHGNFTVWSDSTYINITKSTEGLESKNILTINDGIFKIVASDDGINATGGNSGEMMPGGGGGQPPHNNGDRPDVPSEGFNPSDSFNGDVNINPDVSENMPAPPEGLTHPGMQDKDMPMDFENLTPPPMDNEGGNKNHDRGQDGGERFKNLSDCLVINGGDFEIYAEDDCLDSNGNLILNGGIIKAVKTDGTVTGPNSILDPDGKISISDEVTLVMASRDGGQQSFDYSQKSVTVYGEYKYASGEEIALKDKNQNVVLSYTPNGDYESVMIISPDIKIGDSYTISIGSTEQSFTAMEQNTVIGTKKSSGFDRGDFKRK